MDLQEKQEKVKDFRPIDDVFFEVLAQNVDVCQEILQVIQEDLKKERSDKIQLMIKKGKSKDDILELGYTVEDIFEADEDFLKLVKN